MRNIQNYLGQSQTSVEHQKYGSSFNLTMLSSAP